MICHRVALLLVALLLAQLSFATDNLSPNDWLEKMSRSHRELSYQGLFTYEQAESIHTMRIFHAIINGEEYERLQRLNSDELNVVRKGHGPACMHAGDKLIHLLNKRRGSHAGMAHFYDFSIVASDRVAGREVVVLAVMPRDKHRFGHRFSLDKDTGLLLRAVQYSTDNKVLERFQFVDIELDANIDIEQFIGHDNQQSISHSDPTKPISGALPWQLSWMPGGFNISASKVGDAGVNSKTFTDGLAVFSVFVEPHDNQASSSGVQGRAQRGATMAYSKAFSLDGRPFRVTVVGEIPQATAERVAASIIASGEQL